VLKTPRIRIFITTIIIIIIIIIIIFTLGIGVPEGVQKLWIAKQLRVRYSVRAVCGRQRVVQQNGIETLFFYTPGSIDPRG